MYERFYGLSRPPFAVTPDPAMLYMSKVHREALATIVYGVETRKGFLVCTGEVGTGKSTIIRAFFDQARADAVKLIYIFTPQVTPFEMARYICGELGLDDPESIFAAVPRLQLKLLEEFEAGRTVVLMIDEAQLLPPETLEFLRLLSNFETDTEKLIQIVLVGQPEVDAMLARRDMRQVAQRVALRARLAPFDVEESVEYIDHRLRVSGAADLTQVMSPSAAWLIAEAAGGIPRCINILADNALIAGFGAAQRPLGSQLTGAVVGEFIAKSGDPGPVQLPRLGAGWRAARRLRSALARERGEPAAWLAVAPAPPQPARLLATPPVASQPVRPVAGPPAAPPPQSPRRPAAPRAQAVPRPAVERPAVERPAAAVSPAVAKIAPPPSPRTSNSIAPPANARAVAPAPALGVPSLADGIIMIEPVAEPALDSLPPGAAATLAAPAKGTAGVSPANAAGTAPARTQGAVLVGFAETTPAAAPPSGVPVRWPALSQVRRGLQTPSPGGERGG